MLSPNFQADQLIEPSEDEKRNGWTVETLTAHIKQSQAEEERMLAVPRRRRATAINAWNPLKR